MRYIEQLYNIQNPSFNSIIELNASLVPLQYRSRPWQYPGLNHGTAVLTTEEQCNAYIAAYGNMHQGKINEVLDEIKMAKTEHSHPLGMVVSTHFRCGKGVKRGLKNGALPFNID